MRHCDGETLTMLALDQVVDAGSREHVAGCARCRDEVASLRAVVEVARPDLSGARRIAPHARVWDAVAAATGVTVAPRPERVAATADTPPAGLPPASAPAPAPASAPAPGGPTRRERRAVHPAGRRVRERLPVLAVAAAALAMGLAAGIGGTLAVRDGGAEPAPPERAVLSRTTLEALEAAPGAGGSAQVVRSGSGRVLDVDVSRLEGADGFYEVWLVDRDVRRMVPVGVLHGSRGEFVMPDAIDLGQYPVVDVSVEPLDGDPRHSGVSVLRGTLGA